MVIYNKEKFKVVKSYEELKNQTNYNVLYITDDPNKALVLLLMTYEYTAVGGAYCLYKHCEYLRGNIVVWLNNNDLPEGFKNGLYYKGYDEYTKYRSSFPFPYTPSRCTDSEVVLKINEVKSFLEDLDITITDKKGLKAIWQDVAFNLTWLKGWVRELSIAEQQKIDEEKEQAREHFQNFLSKTFDNIPGLVRCKDYWGEKYKNEWKAQFKQGDIRFTPYTRKMADGTYNISVSSSLFGSFEIHKNHRKVIIKMIELTKKYQDDIFELLLNSEIKENF